MASRLTRADAASGEVPAETWVYRGRPGDPVTLTLRASTRAVLEWGRLTERGWEALASTSDSTTPLRVRPPANDGYFLRVRGPRPGVVARYRLSAVAQPAVGVARLGETAQGVLGVGDPDDNRRYYHEWSYTGTPGEPLVIQMRSNEIDPMLSFGCWTADGLWQELAIADDSGIGREGRDAQITTRVSGSGACVIRAKSYYPPGESTTFAGTGSYFLIVSPGAQM
jgi:hypothetical protein